MLCWKPLQFSARMFIIILNMLASERRLPKLYNARAMPGLVNEDKIRTVDLVVLFLPPPPCLLQRPLKGMVPSHALSGCLVH